MTEKYKAVFTNRGAIEAGGYMSRDINVYLAGPMTGLPDYNFREFAITGHALRKASGCHVVHTANLPRGWSWDKYISLSCTCLRILSNRRRET